MPISKMKKEMLRGLEILMLHKQKMVELKVPDLYSHDQIIGEAGKQVLMKSTGVEVA